MNRLKKQGKSSLSTQEYRQRLLNDITKNRLQNVLDELRGIFSDDPEQKKLVLTLAFKYNSLKNNKRLQTIKKENFEVEYNRLRESLLRIVTELEEKEIFQHLFEENHENYRKAKYKPESRGKRAFKHFKLALLTLFGGILFFVDGQNLVEEGLEIDQCSIKTHKVIVRLEKKVNHGELKSAIENLRSDLQSNSKWALTVLHLKGRLDDLMYEKSYGGLDENEYLISQQTIAYSFMEVLDRLECEDLI